MELYRAVSGEPIPLGRRREHLARRIVFDISAWVDDFGAGNVQLLHQRQGDAAPYPVTITRTAADGVTVDDTTGTLALWDVTNTDTHYPCHFGKAELRYYRGTQAEPEFLVKSDVYNTVVENALGSALPDAPEDTADWLDILLSVAGSDPSGIAAPDLSFRAGSDVALLDGAGFVPAVSAAFRAKAGTPVGVRAQIPLVVASAAMGDAKRGWAALSDATVTAQYVCDNAIQLAAPVRTLDSGDHTLTFLHYFTAQGDGTHNFSLQLRITGGNAHTVSSNIVLGLSGVKEA